MFTGIIQTTGTITRLEISEQHARLGICAPELIQKDLPLGASIAVNGICLTITDWSEEDFAVDVMPETMKRTNLGKLQKGSLVNLEPSLALNANWMVILLQDTLIQQPSS